MLNYRSYGDLSRDVAAHLQKLPDVDIVVGVPKSGLVPAVMIASFKNTKFFDLDTFLFAVSSRSGVRKHGTKPAAKERVLIVDDSVNTGAEFRRVRNRIEHLTGEFDFTLCAVYGCDPARKVPEADVILTYLPQPRIFQWNYRNHIVAEHALFDMDGVLCADPTEAQNDDGPAYLNFLATAAPLAIPRKVISGIVTSRLEKYRPQTEDWLHRNGVKFRELLMLDLPSAEDRRRLKAHAQFKSDIYKARDEFLFVESNWKQAKAIAEAADKAVICTENDIMLLGKDHLAALGKTDRLVAADAMRIEAGLQQDICKLIDRLAVTDPYAATWLAQSGLKHDRARLAELSPFHKTRLVTSSLGRKPARDPASLPAVPKTDGKTRILMISTTFDIGRGAGAAASSSRLRDLLRGAGCEVQTLSLDDFPERRDAHVDQPMSGSSIGMWINYADGQHSRRMAEEVAKTAPDCIVFGAVDRGILSMFDIARLRYPMVWINRDNWAHTGGCLFKLPAEEIALSPAVYEKYLPGLTCDGHKTGCAQCPALNDVRESGKTRTSYEIKRAVLSYRKDLVFAPISSWLAEVLRAAPITAGHSIVAVTNPIDLTVVRKLPKRPGAIRSRHGIAAGEKLVLLAAHALSNPRKGLKLALDALAQDSRFKNCTFVTMGQEDMDARIVPKGMKVLSLGFVASEADKVAIYNEVDVTLLPALQESLSVIGSDSICCGTPVVAFKTSGLASFLRHRETGYLARPFDAADLLDGLHWVLTEADRAQLSKSCLATARASFDAGTNVAALLSAIDQARANFADLGEIPAELEMLSNAMQLINEDHQFRSMAMRTQARKMKDMAGMQGVPPESVFDQIYQLQEKLEWNRKKRTSLEGVIEGLEEKYLGQIDALKANLDWNRKKREELEKLLGASAQE